eukprot:scaffold14695_cov152-Alexandrium_tamarense.AAC.1
MDNKSEVAGSEPGTSGFKPLVANTFNGDRGGSAEDAELLALLRGVSSKSSAGRFADDDDNGAADRVNMGSVAVDKKKSDEMLPPWKASKTKRSATWKQKSATAKKPVDVDAVAAPPVTTAQPVSYAGAEVSNTTATDEASTGVQNEPDTSGFIPLVPNTFNEDRGGSAEDAGDDDVTNAAASVSGSIE